MTVFLLLFVGLLNIFIYFPQYLKFPSQLFVSFLSILISTAEFRRPTRKRGGLEASPTDRLRVVSIKSEDRWALSIIAGLCGARIRSRQR